MSSPPITSLEQISCSSFVRALLQSKLAFTGASGAAGMRPAAAAFLAKETAIASEQRDASAIARLPSSLAYLSLQRCWRA